MMFTKRLRDGVQRGRIRCSVRVWTHPHVKVGGRYPMDEGHIVVDLIAPITLADVTYDLARESGFDSVDDFVEGRPPRPRRQRVSDSVPLPARWRLGHVEVDAAVVKDGGMWAAPQTDLLRASEVGDAKPPAIGARREAGRAFEQAPEERRILVADSPADLVDWRVGPFEPALCILDA